MLQRINDLQTCPGNTCVQIINSIDSNALRGRTYDIEVVESVGNGATVNFVIDPKNMDSDKRLVARPTKWATSTESVIVTLGVCSSYTGGTAITPVNRNYFYQTSNPAKVKIIYNANLTGYVAGSTQILVGTEGTNQNAGGGSYAGNDIIVLDTSLIYVFSVSAAPSALNLGVYIGWLENVKNPELGF